MDRSKFTEEQIADALHRAESGSPPADVFWSYCRRSAVELRA